VLPAVGVALSPLPALAMLLLLGGSRPLLTGSTFWLAWTLGVAVPTIGFVALAEGSGAANDPDAIAIAEIAVGALLVVVAAGVALGRGDAAGSRLLDAFDGSRAWPAAAAAVALSALNPKNLALIVVGAAALAQAHAAGVELAAATLAFVVVAVSTVSLLLVAYRLSAARSRARLVRLRNAVARNDRPLTIVLGVVLGGFFVLDGLRAIT
jgi:hypothetical protein